MKRAAGTPLAQPPAPEIRYTPWFNVPGFIKQGHGADNNAVVLPTTRLALIACNSVSLTWGGYTYAALGDIPAILLRREISGILLKKEGESAAQRAPRARKRFPNARRRGRRRKAGGFWSICNTSNPGC